MNLYKVILITLAISCLCILLVYTRADIICQIEVTISKIDATMSLTFSNIWSKPAIWFFQQIVTFNGVFFFLINKKNMHSAMVIFRHKTRHDGWSIKQKHQFLAKSTCMCLVGKIRKTKWNICQINTLQTFCWLQLNWGKLMHTPDIIGYFI